MTTNELKQYIDKVLGNSIRCLLPSYWWKRLFHQVVDRIDEVEQSVEPKADKDYVDSKVNEAKVSSNQVLFHAPIGGQLSTDKKEVNQQSYQRVMDGYSKGLYFETKVSGGFGILDSIMIVSPDITGGQLKMIILNELGIGFRRLSVSSDGSATIEEIISIDSELSDTSTNAVQNNVIKTALEKIAPSYHNNGFRNFIVQTGQNEGSNKKPRFSFGKKANNADYVIDATVYGQKLDGNNELFMEYNLNGKSYRRLYNAITGVLISEEEIQTDTSNLATKQELNAKQDKIEDLETIRSGAALGATSLQEHQDISHLATKEEVTNLQNEVIANEEVTAAALNELNERIGLLMNIIREREVL